MKTVTLIGGGIGGLALGNLLAAAGVPTVIREAGVYPRHRVCGEFMAGGGSPAWRALEMPDLLTGASTHHRVAWFGEREKVAEYPLPSPVQGLSRYALDQRLAAAFVQKGGRLEVRDRVSRREALPGEGVLWSTGKPSGKSDWLGLKFHVREKGSEPVLEMHLGKQAYVGVSQVEDGKLNVCGLFRRLPEVRAPKKRLARAYLRAVGLTALAERWDESEIDEDSCCAVSGFSFGLARREKSGQLAFGDAFGMIPPFTGNGMTMALESALLIQPDLVRYARGELDWSSTMKQVRRSLEKTFSRRLRLAGWVQGLLDGDVSGRILRHLAEKKLLPFRTLYRLTH